MIKATYIKERRLELGKTQLEVSNAIGVSLPAFRLWEGGGTKPTHENEKKLRKVLRLESEDPDDAEQHSTEI